MNKLTAFLMVVITALCFVLGTTIQSKAQNKAYTTIVPFPTGVDRVGFLDQSNGRIYVYDSNMTKCIFVGQIESLGKPVTEVSTP